LSLAAPSQGELAAPLELKANEPKPQSRREVFDPDSGAFMDVPIYARAGLAPGAHIKGPAVIAEDDTSTVISPSFEARIDRFGYIELNRREG
jgi:N-methylhydantoinase A